LYLLSQLDTLVSKHFVSVALVLRAFRCPLQTPHIALLEGSLTAILSTFTSTFTVSATDIPIEYLLFFTGVAIQKFIDFAQKFFVFVQYWYYVVVDPKQRFAGCWIALAVQLFFFPVVLGAILLSVALGTPIYPLFGIPVFFPASPRTRKQFPGHRSTASTSSLDASYYASVADPVVAAISRDFVNLDAVTCCGDVFVLRHDAQVILVEVMEMHLGQVVLSVKGLELQTTSCHAAEATALDSVLDSTSQFLDSKRGLGAMNQYGFHAAAQVVGRISAEGYASSTSKMDVIIKNPDFLERELPSTIIEVICCLLHKSYSQTGIPAAWITNAPISKSDPSLASVKERTAIPSECANMVAKLTAVQGVSNSTAASRSANKIDVQVSDPFSAVPPPVVRKQSSVEDDGDSDVDDILAWVVKKPAAVRKESSISSLFPSSASALSNAPTTTVLSDGEFIVELLLRAMDFPQCAGSSYAVARAWAGEFPYSQYLEWTKESGNSELAALLKTAFRYAVKIAVDRALMVGPSDLSELTAQMDEFEADWCLGTPGDEEWTRALAAQKSSLFALSSTLEATLCSRQQMQYVVCRMNGELVRAIWASVAMELLWATNDDDERYSIQAHKQFMRNMLVQACDPPLGYPVYASVMSCTN
jgi:hypothetical protein